MTSMSNWIDRGEEGGLPTLKNWVETFSCSTPNVHKMKNSLLVVQDKEHVCEMLSQGLLPSLPT